AALLVHPDKCPHPQAKLAFQKLSEAFDALSQPDARARFQPAKGKGKGFGPSSGSFQSQQRGSKRPSANRPPPTGCWGEPGAAPDAREEVDERGPRGGRQSWWDASWSEFERRLRTREAEEQRREAMEAAVGRGEDSLDAYMAMNEAQMGPTGAPPDGGRREPPPPAGERTPKRPSVGAKATPPTPAAALAAAAAARAAAPSETGPTGPHFRRSSRTARNCGGREAQARASPAATSATSAGSSGDFGSVIADALLGHLDSD
ncbi:unnamed protein product, partial [Polarella glacialis]